MLVRKSKGFDLQPIGSAEYAIEIDAQGMSREFGIQTSTQTPKTVGIVALDGKLVSQLPIDRFDDLTLPTNQASQCWGQRVVGLLRRNATRRTPAICSSSLASVALT